MPVPLIDLKRLEEGFLEQWSFKAELLAKEANFIGGEELKILEENLAKSCETSYAIGCANGTDALQLALRAHGIGPKDIVLLPDLTFWAVFEAIVNVGAHPVTIDLNPDDLQMDYHSFCRALENYTPKAAILTHLYGWASAQIEDFRNLCKEKAITLIEDGAQAYGVSYEGESIYKHAETATISFYPAKVLGAAGDAGALLSSNEEMKQRLCSLANHGRLGHYTHAQVGWNSRMDNLQAAYLNLALNFFPKRLESRRKAALFYQKALADLKGIKCLTEPPGYQGNGYLNVLLLDETKDAETKRNYYARELAKRHIGYAITYPQPISEQKGAYPYLKGKVGGEQARSVSKRILNLPLFAYIEQRELQEVAAAMEEISAQLAA